MDRRIQTVLDKVENDPAVEFSELAAMVNLSASRLRHLFKKETGVTYSVYIKDLRVRKAEVLLRTTFLSVKEIITMVGLSHGTHFREEFKKLFGVSPSRHRFQNGPRRKRVKKPKN